MKFGFKSGAKNKGKFIVIDGVDGSGKATQVQMLAETLRAQGYAFEIVDFPRYGQRSAAMVEDYLNGRYGPLNAYQASILFAVDRFDASFQIRKWLDAGKVVISNRYVTANAGHHGGKIADQVNRIKFFRWLDNLEYGIFNIPKPDLNIILSVPAKTAQKLVDKKAKIQRKYAGGKKRDLHEKDLRHLENAEKVFVEISKLFPNTKMIDCTAEGKLLLPEQIHNKVWNLVRRVVLEIERRRAVRKKK